LRSSWVVQQVWRGKGEGDGDNDVIDRDAGMITKKLVCGSRVIRGVGGGGAVVIGI
jgi:hypothetical protein